MASVSLVSVVIAKRLKGKVALIISGASSIGEATIRLFSKHSAKVAIIDIQDELGYSISKALDTSSASYVYCDVTNEENIEHAINTAISKYSKLDIMYNNIGIVDPFKPSIVDNEKSQFEKVLSVNLVGVFLGMKHAVRVMVLARRGSIIATASVYGCMDGMASHGYTCSKHGIVGFVRNTAMELRPFGIRVNCVSPYAVPI